VQNALMVWIKALDHHQRHPGVDRQGLEQRRASLQAPSGGANLHHRNGGLEAAPEDFAATFSRPFARAAGVFVGPFSFFVTWSSAARSLLAASAVCHQAAEHGPVWAGISSSTAP
jgi:hypothetical protein